MHYRFMKSPRTTMADTHRQWRWRRRWHWLLSGLICTTVGLLPMVFALDGCGESTVWIAGGADG